MNEMDERIVAYWTARSDSDLLRAYAVRNHRTAGLFADEAAIVTAEIVRRGLALPAGDGGVEIPTPMGKALARQHPAHVEQRLRERGMGMFWKY